MDSKTVPALIMSIVQNSVFHLEISLGHERGKKMGRLYRSLLKIIKTAPHKIRSKHHIYFSSFDFCLSL